MEKILVRVPLLVRLFQEKIPKLWEDVPPYEEGEFEAVAGRYARYERDLFVMTFKNSQSAYFRARWEALWLDWTENYEFGIFWKARRRT